MKRYEFHTTSPNKRDLKEVAERINGGEIVIFPTDTIYAMGCLITNRPGIEKICKILDKNEKKVKMSLIFPNISSIAQYTLPIDNHVFKTMKRYLPGPYTFVLKSNKVVQKFFKNTKEEVGVRIPASEILDGLHQYLDGPLISTSLSNDTTLKYYIDPEEIAKFFEHNVDILIDGGMGEIAESTVLDCTNDDIEIIRQGKGQID